MQSRRNFISHSLPVWRHAGRVQRFGATTASASIIGLGDRGREIFNRRSRAQCGMRRAADVSRRRSTRSRRSRQG